MSLPVLPPVIEAMSDDDLGQRNYNSNYIFFWNDVALNLNRITHTTGGYQSGPPLSARFLAILHLAMHDAYFDVLPYAGTNSSFQDHFKPYLSEEALALKRASYPSLPHDSEAAKDAVAGAAITVLEKLFKSPSKPDASVSLETATALGAFVDSTVRSYIQANRPKVRSPAFLYGKDIANLILGQLETKAAEAGVDARDYSPDSQNPYWFSDDQTHPVRPRPIDVNDPEDGNKPTRPYHGPFYGRAASILATTDEIVIADPPVVPARPPSPTGPRTPEHLEYLESVEDVHRMGGAEDLASTKRRPTQTVGALFWAYDGVNLIGTPPRLYNQIIKQIAYDERETTELNTDENNAQFIRLLTLANVAMADAGIFCWRDKYKYELWRPLNGVRGDPTGVHPDGHARPTWRVLGAPATNSNDGGFKPPFPAYPSGHATFGAAAFQMVRLFYDQRGDKKLGQKPGQTDNGFHLVAPGDPSPFPSPAEEKQSPVQDSTGGGDAVDRDVVDDCISFTFISDELNGISRSLYQGYNPSQPIENQPGNVRTRVPVTYKSLKEAIFANGMSRIWLGVHWHFDAFAGMTVCEKYEGGDAGKSTQDPQPPGYEQIFQVEKDGSTKYKGVASMDWFSVRGPRDGTGSHPVGGVPLGIMIADNIFDNKMRSMGSLISLEKNSSMELMWRE